LILLFVVDFNQAWTGNIFTQLSCEKIQTFGNGGLNRLGTSFWRLVVDSYTI